jgi:hypothetical protein
MFEMIMTWIRTRKLERYNLRDSTKMQTKISIQQ